MAIITTTHLNFRGDARAALEFYQSVFGGQVVSITFGDAHNVQSEGGLAAPDEVDQIMWGQVRSDNGFHVMGYDVPSALSTTAATSRSSFRSVATPTPPRRSRSTGGPVRGSDGPGRPGPGPLGCPLYGMLTDRFGVIWVLDVPASY